MDPLIILDHSNIKDLNIRFGSLTFEVERRNMKEEVLGSAENMPVKLTFLRDNVGKRQEKKYEYENFKRVMKALGTIKDMEMRREGIQVKLEAQSNSSLSLPRPGEPFSAKTDAQDAYRFRF